MNPLVILGALAFDLVVGEPPAAVHPVVWMGKLIGWFERRRPADAKGQLALGTRLVVTGVVLSFGLSWVVLYGVGRFSLTAQLMVAIVLLKMTFAVRALGGQALRVRWRLAASDLDGARREVQNLVSRDASALGPRQVTAAAVESVAENTLDSIVAPLFWFLLLGVPGAMAYRFVNTADAMVGYHGEYEYLGKAAARLDDALNWVPARISSGLLVAGSWLAGFRAARAWDVAVRDHGLTESPNAGWTMAAAAGALAVPLEKAGHYRLGEDAAASSLIPRKIGDAVLLMAVVACLAVLAVAVLQAATPLGHLPWVG